MIFWAFFLVAKPHFVYSDGGGPWCQALYVAGEFVCEAL